MLTPVEMLTKTIQYNTIMDNCSLYRWEINTWTPFTKSSSTWCKQCASVRSKLQRMNYTSTSIYLWYFTNMKCFRLFWKIPPINYCFSIWGDVSKKGAQQIGWVERASLSLLCLADLSHPITTLNAIHGCFTKCIINIYTWQKMLPLQIDLIICALHIYIYVCIS